MNEVDIQALWDQPSNRPTPQEEARLKAELLRRVQRRRRLEWGALAWGSVGLGLATFLWARLMLRSQASATLIWSAVPLIFLPWALVIHRIRGNRLRARASLGLSTLDALRTAQAEHLAARTRLRAFAGLWVISVPVFGLLISDLQAAEKARPHEGASMALVLGALLLAGAGAAGWVWFKKLRPEGARIAALLRAFEP